MLQLSGINFCRKKTLKFISLNLLVLFYPLQMQSTVSTSLLHVLVSLICIPDQIYTLFPNSAQHNQNQSLPLKVSTHFHIFLKLIHQLLEFNNLQSSVPISNQFYSNEFLPNLRLCSLYSYVSLKVLLFLLLYLSVLIISYVTPYLNFLFSSFISSKLSRLLGLKIGQQFPGQG
jgi:hypothetical protein